MDKLNQSINHFLLIPLFSQLYSILLNNFLLIFPNMMIENGINTTEKVILKIKIVLATKSITQIVGLNLRKIGLNTSKESDELIRSGITK